MRPEIWEWAGVMLIGLLFLGGAGYLVLCLSVWLADDGTRGKHRADEW